MCLPKNNDWLKCLIACVLYRTPGYAKSHLQTTFKNEHINMYIYVIRILQTLLNAKYIKNINSQQKSTKMKFTSIQKTNNFGFGLNKICDKVE